MLVDAVRSAGSTALLSSHVITDIEQAWDSLIVLGGGRALLAVSIGEAIAGHRVIAEDDPQPIGVHVVGSFLSATGERLSLVRGLAGRPATLEEVVIGHLAADRPTRPDRASTIAAA